MNSLTDYCELGRELCKWKTVPSDNTWHTVTRNERKGLEERLMAEMTTKDALYKGTIIIPRNKQDKIRHLRGMSLRELKMVEV